MLGRRGSSFGLQVLSVAIVLIMFVYGFYLYRSVYHQLENVEKDNSQLILEKEDLSKDIQVLRESKLKLESMLKDTENECSANENRLGGELKKIRDDLSLEKASCAEQSNIWSNEKAELQLKNSDLSDEKSQINLKLSEVEGELNSMKDENFNLKRTKQEGLNDVAKLNDEVANLLRKVKELSKLKELYEASKPTSNDTKTEVKKVKQEANEVDLQIVEPVAGENQGYFETKTVKPHEPNQEINKPVEGQVAPPLVQNNKPSNEDEVKIHRENNFKPDLPDQAIPKLAEMDVGGANQVEKPDLKLPAERKDKFMENKPKEVPKEVDELKGLPEESLDQRMEEKVPAIGAEGVDDEDMVDDAIGDLRGANRNADNMPVHGGDEAEVNIADDVELHQRKHDGGEP